MAKKISQLPVATSIDGTELVEVVQGGASKQAAANLFGGALPPGYIDGLKLVWVSGTAITVTSGAAYIPGPAKVVKASADIAKTGLSLAANTWYHVYLYDNAGTPAVEIVTAAPSAPYNGTARTKTGDTSRRYIGSVLTDASGNVLKFRQVASKVRYLSGGITVLSGGTATSATDVACSSAVPVSAYIATTNFSNIAGQTVVVGNSEISGGLSSSVWMFAVQPSGRQNADVVLDSSQRFNYLYTSAPSQSVLAIVTGYEYER